MNKIEIEKFYPTPIDSNQTAIVFVHGFSGDRKGTWGRIPEFMRADKRIDPWDLFGFGYQSRKRIDLLGLWSADARLEEIAIKLIHTPELANKNYKTLAFVAHSMGGLVIQRALVISKELRQRTTHLFLLGTPCGSGESNANFMAEAASEQHECERRIHRATKERLAQSCARYRPSFPPLRHGG